jgi:hypothetical protein
MGQTGIRAECARLARRKKKEILNEEISKEIKRKE